MTPEQEKQYDQKYHSGKDNHQFKHGMRNTSTYASWCDMKYRCNNSNHRFYKHYGGRGISYDSRWESFEEFYKDMGDRPHKTMLDRKNNDLDYSKENCRWANLSLSNHNRRGYSGKGLPKGVRVSGNSFVAAIRVEGKYYHLGSFTTSELAAIEYNKISEEWYGK